MPRKSSVDSKLERAGFAPKFALSAKPQPAPGNVRGQMKYGKHSEFEASIAAVEQDIARLEPELRRARRKRRSLLAAMRQRCRYERTPEFRKSEQKRMRDSFKDRFHAPDDYRF